jgi:DNA invertase Pin-like site-specific DNA recombinase
MALIGYATVSIADQNLDRQFDELRVHGCDRVYGEAASGKRGAARPQFDARLERELLVERTHSGLAAARAGQGRRTKAQL